MPSSASDLPAARARRAFRLKARTRLRLLVRTSIRDSEIGQVLLAALIGGVVALGVALVRQAVREIHHLLFGVPFEMHLSGGVAIESWRLVAVPAVGGLAYGLVAYALRRWRPRDIVDAIGKQRGPTSKDAMPIGPFRTETVPVNVRDLDRFDAGEEVTPETLVGKGILKNTKIDVKVLGMGDITKKLTVRVHAISASARKNSPALPSLSL